MKLYISTLLLGSLTLAGCSGAANRTTGPSNSVVNTNTKTNATPDTERVGENEKDYVLSETGTAKATPEAGKANVQGKVVFNGAPAVGVEVKLCEKFSRFMGECSGETYKTKTDDAGEYLMSNVTAKIYEGLLVKVFDTNSFVFATTKFGITSARYKIDADKTYFAPVTNLFKTDLKLQEPKTNATVAGASLKVKWEPYTGATYYRLSVSPAEYDADSTVTNERVETAEYTVNKMLKPGKYSISLSAYNAEDIKLSELKDHVAFTVK
jgi:hypothetical protein